MIEIFTQEHRLLGLLTTWAIGIADSRAPNEIIERHGSPYIERWMLARKVTVPTFVGRATVTVLPPDDPTPMPTELENVYLHRYCRDDAEGLHCHPWANVSLILRGQFTEDMGDGQAARRQAGDVIIRRADQRHAIRRVEPGTMSLFATAPKVREWGFYPDGEFVHHAAYRQLMLDRGVMIDG